MHFTIPHLLLLIVSFQVVAQSDIDFFLFPPAVPLAVAFDSDSTPVSLEFAIGSTQTLKWETKLPSYKIVGRMVLSEDGAEDLIIYVKNKTDPELGTYEWTVPDPPETLPYWLYISVSDSLKCKSMPFNISEADLLHSPSPSTSLPSLASRGPTGSPAAGTASSFSTSVSAPNDTTDGGNLDDNGVNASKTGPLGIGLGVGLGVPILMLIVAGIYYANRHSKKQPPPPPAANQQEIKYPAMLEMAGSEYHPELYGRQVGIQRSELPVKRDMRIELPAKRETLEMAID